MSSIFSTETNNIEGLVFTSAHGLLETATSTAYGLGTDNAVEGSAITPSLDPLLPSKANLESQSITTSDPLLAEFVEDGAAYHTTATHIDAITGMNSGEIYSQISQETTSTSRVSGSLDFWDDFNPTRQGAFKDDYTLSSETTTTVQVNLGSGSFDTFLQLVDLSTGQVLAQDDDGGSGTDSQLTFTAQAGQQYTLRVTSYFANATGGYDLTAYFNNDQPTPPDNPAREFSSAFGYGLVDAAAAVAAAIGQSPFSEVPNSSNELWNNHMINAPEVWNQGFTGESITVAVIDSGVDINHADLRDNIWENTDEIYGDGIDNDGNGYIDDRYGWNFGVGQNNPDVRPGTNDPGQDHGTHVAGTIAAVNNGFGMTGVAYDSNIMAIRLGDIQTDSLGRGLFVNGGDLAEAIIYAVDNGADVINMSIGWGDADGRVREALAYAAENNVIAVSASGNEAASMPGTPARYATDYGISVGSLDINGTPASRSNQAGADSRMHHVMAPGVDIFSTTVNNDWNVKSGTSMAAPHVAGVVALMLSANRNLTHDQVRAILTGTTFSTNVTAQTAYSMPSEEWPVSVTPSVALPNFDRWRGVIIEGDHYTPITPSTSTLDDTNPLLSSASSASAVYEFLLEQSAEFSASHTDSWQHELIQPLFDADLLVGIAA